MPADAPGGLNEPRVKESPDSWTIADRVGHADPSFTLRRYSYLLAERRKKAAINLGGLIGAVDEAQGEPQDADSKGVRNAEDHAADGRGEGDVPSPK